MAALGRRGAGSVQYYAMGRLRPQAVTSAEALSPDGAFLLAAHRGNSDQKRILIRFRISLISILNQSNLPNGSNRYRQGAVTGTLAKAGGGIPLLKAT